MISTGWKNNKSKEALEQAYEECKGREGYLGGDRGYETIMDSRPLEVSLLFIGSVEAMLLAEMHPGICEDACNPLSWQ